MAVSSNVLRVKWKEHNINSAVDCIQLVSEWLFIAPKSNADAAVVDSGIAVIIAFENPLAGLNNHSGSTQTWRAPTRWLCSRCLFNPCKTQTCPNSMSIWHSTLNSLTQPCGFICHVNYIHRAQRYLTCKDIFFFFSYELHHGYREKLY